MTITIPSDLQAQLVKRAREAGVPVDTYLECLIRDDVAWGERSRPVLDEQDPDFADIRTKVRQGMRQAERGEGRPAKEVFARLRTKHGLSR